MTLRRSIALSALTVLLAFGTTAFAVDPPDPPVPPVPPDRPERIHHGDGEPKVSIFNDVTVEKGEREKGVVCVRGDVRIDGDVDGDVVAVMGDVTLNGTINGNLVAVMGDIELGDHAVINGDVTNVGGKLDRGEAEIRGNVVNASPFGSRFPGMNGWDLGGLGLAWLFPWGTIFGLFLFFVGAIVLSALVPERIRLISEEAPLRLFTAALFGLLGYMLLIVTSFILIITLIGIPVFVVGIFTFIVLKWMAMCGLFHYVGKRIARSFGRETSFLGAILIGFTPFALIRLIPTCCFGWCVWSAVEVVAFGMLIITRLGTRPGGVMPVPAAAVIVPPPSPPEPSVPPV